MCIEIPVSWNCAGQLGAQGFLIGLASFVARGPLARSLVVSLARFALLARSFALRLFRSFVRALFRGWTLGGSGSSLGKLLGALGGSWGAPGELWGALERLWERSGRPCRR